MERLPKSWERMLQGAIGAEQQSVLEVPGGFAGVDWGKGLKNLGRAYLEEKIPALGKQKTYGSLEESLAALETGEIPTYESTIAGVKALLRPKGLSNAVEALAKTGVIPEGSPWIKTAGKWMWEFSDEAAKLQPHIAGALEEILKRGEFRGIYGKLSDIIDHPELFKNYPQMAETPVNIMMRPGMKEAAGVHYGKQGISVESGKVDDILTTLVHEWQHGVSDIEGFPRGGSAAMFMEALDVDPRTAQEMYRRLGGEQLSYAAEQRAKFSAEQLKDFPLRTFTAPENRWLLLGKKELPSMENETIARMLSEPRIAERLAKREAEWGNLPVLDLWSGR